MSDMSDVLAVMDANTTSDTTPVSSYVESTTTAADDVPVPGPGDFLWPGIRSIITDSIINAPRSKQRSIGPSELGTDCVHCLAAKLAGWQQTVSDAAWLPFIGTCVHEHFERLFTNLPNNPDNYTRYLTEYRVSVGNLFGVAGGYKVNGSIDLVDLKYHATIDWKIVGPSTLKNAKANGPSQQYQVQASLYGIGLVNEGRTVEKNCIYFLPRTSSSLSDAFAWEVPFSPLLGQWALNRAQMLVTILDNIELQNGVEVRDAWIRSLPHSTTHCFDCDKWPDSGLAAEFTPDEVVIPESFTALIPFIQPTPTFTK